MDDERPEVAIGHVVMHVSDVRKSTAFYLKLGLRGSGEEVRPGMSILELLGNRVTARSTSTFLIHGIATRLLLRNMILLKYRYAAVKRKS